MKDKKRYYNFLLVLYKEDKDFKEQFKVLKTLGQLIWIEHNKDFTEEGKKKKSHYHFILNLKNALTISNLSKKVGCKENMIEPVKKSVKSCLRYLIHYDDEKQYQYDPSEVKSNSEKLLKKFKDSINEEEPSEVKAEAIEVIIDNFNNYISLKDISPIIRESGQWTYFLRYFTYFSKYIEQHNRDLCSEFYKQTNNINNYSVNIDLPFD